MCCASLVVVVSLGTTNFVEEGFVRAGVQWIGVSVDLRIWDSVVISFPRSFADSVLELIAGILGETSVPIEAIQRLGGKAGWAAGIAPVLWAQVASLWAACADVARLQVARASGGFVKRAKVGVCRTRQALVWLHELFQNFGPVSSPHTVSIVSCVFLCVLLSLAFSLAAFFVSRRTLFAARRARFGMAASTNGHWILEIA